MSALLKFVAEALISQPHFRGRGRILGVLLPRLASVRSHYGVEFAVNASDATNRYSILGLYGDFVSSTIRSLPRRDAVFLDIGANAGLFGLLAAAHLRDGIVFAFEPNPIVYRQLLRNIELNATTNLIPLHVALSEHPGLLPLTFDPQHSGVSRLVLHQSTNHTRDRPFLVPALPVDSLPFIAETAKGRPVYAKIDVEGYEVSILRMLFASRLAAALETIIVEIDPANLANFNHTVDDLYATAERAGFEGKLGRGHAEHYDEVFARVQPPKRNPSASSSSLVSTVSGDTGISRASPG